MSEEAARPTIDNVAAEVAGEILRHYLPDASLLERQYHVRSAIIAGARLLVPELADDGPGHWGCAEDIDEELLSQNDDRRGLTFALLAMVKAAVAAMVATVDLTPGKRTPIQRLNQTILSEARPHLEALANQNIDTDIIVEQIACLRQWPVSVRRPAGESRSGMNCRAPGCTLVKLPWFEELASNAQSMTAGELAVLYGWHRTLIYKKAAAPGWTYVSDVKRKLPAAADLRKIVKAEPGITSIEIQARFGVSPTTVSLGCRAVGIKLRRKPYARRRSQEARS